MTGIQVSNHVYEAKEQDQETESWFGETGCEIKVTERFNIFRQDEILVFNKNFILFSWEKTSLV